MLVILRSQGVYTQNESYKTPWVFSSSYEIVPLAVAMRLSKMGSIIFSNTVLSTMSYVKPIGPVASLTTWVINIELEMKKESKNARLG